MKTENYNQLISGYNSVLTRQNNSPRRTPRVARACQGRHGNSNLLNLLCGATQPCSNRNRRGTDQQGAKQQETECINNNELCNYFFGKFVIVRIFLYLCIVFLIG